MAHAQRDVVLEIPVPAIDARWTLEEDDVPETPLHELSIRVLLSVLRCWIGRTGRDAMAGRNIALCWSKTSPTIGVDPDVYLVEPAPPLRTRETSLCLWKKGHHPPRVAVEVVSENSAAKDYGDGPQRYAASGTRELWIFDPLKFGADPVMLQVFRRTPKGGFRRVYQGDGPAFSRELGAWLVLTDDGLGLRVADDAAGKRCWPTEVEHEATARTLAEAELARLRAQVARPRRKS